MIAENFVKKLLRRFEDIKVFCRALDLFSRTPYVDFSGVGYRCTGSYEHFVTRR